MNYIEILEKNRNFKIDVELKSIERIIEFIKEYKDYSNIGHEIFNIERCIHSIKEINFDYSIKKNEYK